LLGLIGALQIGLYFVLVDSATFGTGTVQMPMRVHFGATWRTRLNRPCAVAMRSFDKLL